MIWVTLNIMTIGTVLVCGFVLVMNAYYKPRTEIPRGIPVPVLIVILWSWAYSAVSLR